MAATTTEIPERRKLARIRRTGIRQAPHALMIDAPATQMTLLERRQAFIASASKQNKKSPNMVWSTKQIGIQLSQQYWM